MQGAPLAAHQHRARAFLESFVLDPFSVVLVSPMAVGGAGLCAAAVVIACAG